MFMKLDYKKRLFGLLFFAAFSANAQVGVNTTNPQAQLDIVASNATTPSNTDGLLIPRVDTFPAVNPTATQQGMLVYLTTTVGANPPGFYYWNNTTITWTSIAVANPSWNLTGNSGTVSGTNFIGTTDNQALDIRTNNTIKVRITAKGQIEVLNTGDSVFIGENAGLNDDLSANQNVFIGAEAGRNNTIGTGNTFVGQNAGTNTTTGTANVFIGRNAGNFNSTGTWNNALGDSALQNNSTGSNNVALGRAALANNATGVSNIAIGRLALASRSSGNFNTAIGDRAFWVNNSGNNNVSLGADTGANNTTGSNNTFIGHNSGSNNNGSSNVFLGNQSGSNETGSDKLYIDNSNTANPLIYGDFATNVLRVNGTLNVNNAYNLPTTVGTANQVLQTDGAGNTSWVNPSTGAETDPQVSSTTTNYIPKWNGTTLVDGQVFDNGTNVGVGTATPLDKVHVVGNVRIDGGKIPFFNTGQSVFIGQNAGQNDDLTNNENVYIGHDAGRTNSTGFSNTAIGRGALQNATGSINTAVGRSALNSLTTGGLNTAIGEAALLSSTTSNNNTAVGSSALRLNTTGNFNTAIGKDAGNQNNGGNNTFLGGQAGFLNTTGSRNVFIGYNAGYNETGSDKLYIDNNNTTTPLIFGDFATDLLRVNGTLNINNAYNLPTTAGTANQVLQTNGAGVASWVNPSSLAISEVDPQVSSTTTNFIPKWNGTALVDGQVFDNATNVGIGTATPTEKLDVNGKTKTTNIQVTNGATNGFVLQSDAIGNGTWVNPSSLTITETDPQVSSTTTNYIPKWNGTTLVDGLVFDNGTNIGIGTTTPNDKVHVVGNVKIDGGKLPFVNTGQSVFVGENAGLNDDLSNNQNVFIGWESGKLNSTGNLNVFVGHGSGMVNTTGANNSAFGQFALGNNTTGANNTAIGRAALSGNTTGTLNTALGLSALEKNSSGTANVSFGFSSLENNLNGNFNTALGSAAGRNNMGSRNVFLGYNAGYDEAGSDKLYIDNTSTVAPLVYGDFVTNLLKVNGTLNVNNAYNLPTTAGTANQILQTDGAGNTSWVNPAVLAETDPQVSSTTTNFIPKWDGTTLVDGQVFDNGTNVGVGTVTPSTHLHIASDNTNFNTTIESGNLQYPTALHILPSSHATSRRSTIKLDDWSVLQDVTGTGTKDFTIYQGATGLQRLSINTAGNVGIGINNPTEKLDVNGKTKTTDIQMTNGATNGFILQSDATGNATWVNPSSLTVSETDPQVSSTTTNYIPKWNGSTLTDGIVYDNGTNVGIGTATPTSKLEVIGNTSTTNFQMTNGASGGFVLRSNAFGNASWVNPNSLGISESDPQVQSSVIGFIPKWDGAKLVDSKIFETTANIGIGTTTPTEKLDVNGKTKTTDIQVTNGATNGFILQSDATGNGTWVNPTSLSITETDPQVSSTTSNYIPKWNGTSLVDGQVFDNGTNVGIGTATPTDKVHVVGNMKIDGGKIPFVNTGQSVFIGDGAGANDDLTGNQNVFVGHNAGNLNDTGTRNTAFGTLAFASNTSGRFNTAIGYSSLSANTTGTSHIAIGESSLLSTTTSTGSIAIGTSSLKLATIANNNVSIGNSTMTNATTANNNVAIGALALGNTTSTSNSVAIGTESGRNNLTGTGNVFIGYLSGYNETGSNKLYIDNSNTTTPLIFGDFGTNLLRVNGTLNINNAYNLPTTAGIANQVLQTNGAGVTSWIDASTLTITENDPQVSSTTTNYMPKWDGTTLVDGQVFDNGTNVGIGTATPTQAKLVVSGFTSNSVGNFGQFKNDGTGSTNTTGTPYAYSIYASNRIAASEFNAFSDARIKNIKGITNTKQDLETLSKIEITNYTLKDSISKGNNNYKKVIAQQVEKVYPQAVNKLTDVVPDIYKQAEIKDGFIALENNLKAGEKVKIITQKGEEIVTVLEANSKGFKISTTTNGLVFVYGRQVSDFRSVDYEALSTLNISATQELLKQIEELNARLNTTENENAKLKAEVQTLNDVKSDVEMLKKMMFDSNSSKIETTSKN